MILIVDSYKYIIILLLPCTYGYLIVQLLGA